MTDRPAVVCISLEPWDRTWRRNQHFASRLVRQGLVSRLVFVEPPRPGLGARAWSPQTGIRVVRPPLALPKRAGGLHICGRQLQRSALRAADVVWVNDPALGVHCRSAGARVVYDVTDDLRTFAQPGYITDRIVAAEDLLARTADTIVCSEELARRWRDRYDVVATVVHNAVDVEAFATAVPVTNTGASPHIGYVGTLHAHRLDIDLVLQLADACPGTIHLVGPNSLEEPDRDRLAAHPRVSVHGPVDAADVPGWMRAMDVLISPHVVNEFTLSLDAIKSREYLAAGRPVVATPTSGFQLLSSPGLTVVDRQGFSATVLAAVGRSVPVTTVVGWDERTREFARALLSRA